ncbi:hypothetical protein M422DRAFT_238685 [Sphaerobolus stellatus SS14]|nr:hypothetical protein M422DRAFT_238685 [Sphaerobolus stellatus SS14]
MALNWTMLDEARKPVPLNEDEHIVKDIESSEVTLIISEGEGKTKTLKANGRLWLSDARLIFVRDTVSAAAPFDSVSVPLINILSTSYKQPVFGTNYVAIDIRPTSGGGLTEGTKAEIRINDQGIFGFWNALQKMREMAVEKKRTRAGEDELPSYDAPPYDPFAAGPSRTQAPGHQPIATGAGSGGIPSDAPPGYEA